MSYLPSKNRLLNNFSQCNSWEEKYLYIIELGELLPKIPSTIQTFDYLISGCQSQVWIILSIDNNGNVKLDGNSDAAIVKGLIATIFVFYQGLTLSEIIKFDIYPFFRKLSLIKHLTPSRSHGMKSIIRAIRSQAASLLF